MTTWLAIIGMGLDPKEPLPAKAHGYLEQAELILGDKRHHHRISSQFSPKITPWQKPFSKNLPLILQRKKIVILATGDPLFFGIASSLSHLDDAPPMIILPAVSSFSHAAARMSWALQDTICNSVHGRPIKQLLPLLRDGGHYLILGEDKDTPRHCAALLKQAGYGDSRLTLMEELECEDETITHWQINDNKPIKDAHPLHIMALECRASHKYHAPLLGLEDDDFSHDRITKDIPRSLALVALKPFQGGLLWDVGAGGGSITIEWLRAHKNNRSIAIEKDKDHCHIIAAHADKFGVEERLTIIHDTAPKGLHNLLPEPRAIFIGGAIAQRDLVAFATRQLMIGGVLVAHAVTLKGQQSLMDYVQQWGGTLRHLQWSHLAAMQNTEHQAFTSPRPLLQWIWNKDDAS